MYKSINGSIKIDDKPDLTVKDFSENVWKHFEDEDLARAPFPVKNKVPNFEAIAKCTELLSSQPEFKNAESIIMNKTSHLDDARYRALKEDKKVLIPGLHFQKKSVCSVLENKDLSPYKLRVLANRDYLRSGLKIDRVGIENLTSETPVSASLMVVGSVAVSQSGRRIGVEWGEGWHNNRALEMAVFNRVKIINSDVVIATLVHDCQVFNEIPDRLFENSSAIPVDLIITPTQVIRVNPRASRNLNFEWSEISPDLLRMYPILRRLREKDAESGINTDLKLRQPRNREANAAVSSGTDTGTPSPQPNDSVYSTPVGPQEPALSAPNGEMPEAVENGARAAGTNEKRKKKKNTRRSVPNYAKTIQILLRLNKDNAIVSREVRTSTLPKREERNKHTFSLYIGHIPFFARYIDLVAELLERDARPVDVTWRKDIKTAFVHYNKYHQDAEHVIQSLKGMKIRGAKVAVDRARIRGAGPYGRLPTAVVAGSADPSSSARETPELSSDSREDGVPNEGLQAQNAPEHQDILDNLVVQIENKLAINDQPQQIVLKLNSTPLGSRIPAPGTQNPTPDVIRQPSQGV